MEIIFPFFIIILFIYLVGILIHEVTNDDSGYSRRINRAIAQQREEELRESQQQRERNQSIAFWRSILSGVGTPLEQEVARQCLAIYGIFVDNSDTTHTKASSYAYDCRCVDCVKLYSDELRRHCDS